MRSQKTKIRTSTIAPLLLFVVFTTCILFVLLTGADTYKKLSQRDRDSFQHRTVAQYLTTRIRQNDSLNMIQVSNFSEGENHSVAGTMSQGDTLILREEIAGRTYYTRIYCHDGYLRELFSPAGVEFSLSAGDQILEVNSLHFTLDQDLLSIQIAYTDNSTQTLFLHIRSTEEVLS